MDKTYGMWLQELAEALELARGKANRALAEGPTVRDRELTMDISEKIAELSHTVSHMREYDRLRQK